MKNVEYERSLDVDARIRAQYQISQGRVIRFTVQLEVFAEGQWRPVVRYDTAHRFAHRDLYPPRGRAIKANLRMTFNDALTHALRDLQENWEIYREQFLKKR